MTTTLKTPIRLRNMKGEAEVEEGYVGVYEVILNPDTPLEERFGTFDRAPVGSRHRLQSWCGEYVGFRGGRGIPWKWIREELGKL